MEKDGYLHYPSGSTTVREGFDFNRDDGASSSEAHSATSLRNRGAAMGTTGTAAQDADARSNTSHTTSTHEVKEGIPEEENEEDDDEEALGNAIRAGMPIGYLAARGTPYAKKPIYRSHKCQVLCPIVGGLALVVGTVILLFPVLRAVALHTLSTAVLTVSSSNITSPTNSSFALTLEGQAHKVGIFPAHLFFERPVQVFWVAPENLTQELLLGQFPMEPIGVAAGHGRIKQSTHFTIIDESAFARFTQYLITQEEFTWRLRSQHVQAKAFSFIAVNNLDFVKDLTLPGMANMTDISISDFQLPGDDPAGGISLAVTTKLTNPSAFGVEIGILQVDLYYQDLYLGPAQTATPMNLTTGVNEVHLVGRLVPYANNPAALAQQSVVFSQYINGEVTVVQARGRSVTLPNGEVIDYLQKGIQALILTVPLSSPTGPILPIQGIAIEALSLAFDTSAPYAPLANSSQVSAAFGLPFGFSLSIVELSNSFEIVENGTAVAGLSSPMGSSDTTTLTRTAGYTSGSITLTLPQSSLVVGDTYTDHLAFSQFNYDLTTTNGSRFALVGNATAVTDTPLGQVKLSDIRFAVPAGLIGLESLAAYPTTIISVDVTGGTTEGVTLAITVGLTNPSNLDLVMGDVTFQLFNGDSFLGTALLPNLHLARGYQEVASIGNFEANGNPIALGTLTNYTNGISSDLTISGFNGSTPIDSLTQALMAIHLRTTLAGLTTKLLEYANLTVLSSTGIINNIANSIVSLDNPFTSPLVITNIQSNITSHDLFVGSIVVDTDFTAAGKASSISPVLPFNLNLYPPDIFSLVRALVVETGMDPSPLDGLVALGGYTYSPSTPNARKRLGKRIDSEFIGGISEDPNQWKMFLDDTAVVKLGIVGRNLRKRYNYVGFDLPSYILQAFQSLTVNVDLVSVLHIGDFTTNLAYSQAGVPAYTDSTLTLLLPVLARPIVQKIVDQAILNVTTVMITDPTNTVFTAGLVGMITDAGPFDATISFPEGLTVAWNGAPLGQISMPNVPVVANVGATLNLNAAFNVADVGHLTDFTSYLLTEPSFVWQIYGQNLSVSALGITVPGISIMKSVVLAGMNGFKGLVKVDSFDLPANDPAGGITLTLQTTLTNPSSVGVALSTIGFSNTFGSTTLGPASSTGAFSLSPKSTISLPLSGRLIPQTTPQGLADVSTLFNGYIHGVPSQLVVHGTNAGPADVSWLNNGITKLAIGVILPAASNLQVINSITINQVTLAFTQSSPWAPSFSTNNTVALFQLPFAFPVDITQISTGITANDPAPATRERDTGDFASLNVPLGPSITNVIARSTLIEFANVPFTSSDNGVFSGFLTETTDDTSKSFNLRGLASTITSTAVGDLSLSDISFAVSTSLLGLQGLNAQPATVSDLDVFHGYPSYLQINVNAHLFNPSSQITIATGNVAFGLQFQNQDIGSAVITNLVLVPGANVIATAVHYQPSGGASTASGQILLENYIQGIPSSTLIIGTSDTTPIASLKQALLTIQLGTTIPPLEQNLITQASLTFPLNIAQTSTAQSSFVLGNPFTATINLVEVIANATYNDLFLGQINQPTLDPEVTAPGHSTITSRKLPFSLYADPKTLARFVEEAAAAQGVNLGILLPELNYILGLSSTETSVTASVNQQPETCTPTGTSSAVEALIIAAVQNLKANLTIQSVAKLDDYRTQLDFVQNNVATVLDKTVLYLTTILGPPIVAHIVELAELSFSQAIVTNVTNSGFTASLTGSLLNAGPFDALIEFPGGVNIIWDGSKIASISLPPICSTGGSGVPNLQTTGILTISDESRFTDFATYILLNPSFTWTITTNTLRVSALSTIFDNVTLTKNVSFNAFNGLPGVTISNPNFPSDAPDGIALVTDSLIPSPSNLGIELGHASFIASFEGQEVGPIDAFGLTLAPLTTTSAQLTGTIIKRTSAASTASLGVLFSQFLAGSNQTLNVQGNEVISPAQPNSPVTWLSTAFKKLTLEVVLPGHTYEIISSITLQDLTVTITSQADAYTVPTQNNLTNIVYKNPFGFSLTVEQAGGAFYINYNSVDTALLTLPVADVLSAQTSTGQNAALSINFEKPENLVALNDDSFNAFFSTITNTPQASFTLHGAANVSALTNAGTIPITGVPFSVSTSFPGINGFGGTATIPNIPIVLGGGSGDPFNPTAGSTFIRISLTTLLNDPAPLILYTNLISFAVIYQDYQVGRAYVTPLNLYSGTNSLAAEFHYQPSDPANTIAQSLLALYLETTGEIPLTIKGDASSSPYGSLQEALEGVSLAASFPGQGLPLVHDIVIYLDPINAICDNSVSIETRMNNHLETFVTILSLTGTAFQNGAQYASFTYTFKNPFTTTAGEAPGPYSEMIGPVNLTQGVLASLVLLDTESDGLDITITAEASIGGYIAPSLTYTQKAVPYTIVPTLDGLALDPGTLGQVLSDPLGSIADLINELVSLTTCVGGVLSLVSGVLSDLTNLPSIIISLIEGATTPISEVSSILANVTSVGSEVISGASSLVRSVISGASSAVSSVLSESTSAAGSVGSDVSSVVSEVSSAVSAVVSNPTSALSAAASGGESVVSSVISDFTGALGTALGGVTLRRRLEPTTPSFTSIPSPLPTAPHPAVSGISPIRFMEAADKMGISPQDLQKVLAKHGYTKAQELDSWRRERDEREKEKQMG